MRIPASATPATATKQHPTPPQSGFARLMFTQERTLLEAKVSADTHRRHTSKGKANYSNKRENTVCPPALEGSLSDPIRYLAREISHPALNELDQSRLATVLFEEDATPRGRPHDSPHDPRCHNPVISVRDPLLLPRREVSLKIAETHLYRVVAGDHSAVLNLDV